MRWLVIALISGCSPASVDVYMGDRYIYDEDPDEVTAAMSISEVEDAMQEALGIARNYNSDVVLETYEEMMTIRSGGCPNYYDSSTSSSWNDECTTDEGSTFSGYVYTGNGETSWWISAGAVIEAADGERFELTGSASAWQNVSEYGKSKGSSVKGTFQTTGGAAVDTWLSGEVSPDLSVTSWYGYGDWGTKSITLNGVVFITSEKAAIVSFDELRAVGNVSGSVECSIEPSGTISVRGNEGYWYDVVFDGLGSESSEEEVLAPEDCDGCGRLFFRGELLGDACVDTTSVLAWDETP
jgi:hypothetical protein